MLTPADTAYSIAAIRALEGERPRADRLFDDPYASVFSAAGAHAREGTERFMQLPFFVDAIRLRTRFIDDFVRDGLRQGAKQLVLLGAGFDMRALRIEEVSESAVAVYEVDFAGQLEKKRELLAGAGLSLPPWIRHVPCDFVLPDFEKNLGPALEERGFRPGAGTLFIWEGVIAYIDAASMKRSLTFMADTGGDGARVVFDFGRGAFVTESMAERVQRAGFTHFEEVPLDEVWRRYLPGPPHPNASSACMGVATCTIAGA